MALESQPRPGEQPVGADPEDQEVDRQQLRTSALNYLQQAMNLVEEADKREIRRVRLRSSILLDYARLGEFEIVGEELVEASDYVQEYFVDALYVQIQYGDQSLRVPHLLQYFDAIDSDSKRMVRLLGLSGGFIESIKKNQGLDVLDSKAIKSWIDRFTQEEFSVQALALAEKYGGLESLPQDSEEIRSDWLELQGAFSGGGRLPRVGIDRYPGQAEMILAFARAHMLQGNYERSSAHLQRLENDPQVMVKGMQELAAVQHANGEHERALETLQSAAVLAKDFDYLALSKLTRQLDAYGDQETMRPILVRYARAKAARIAGIDPGNAESYLRSAIGGPCNLLREIEGQEELLDVLQFCSNELNALPNEHPAHQVLPRIEASWALIVGDPAGAERFLSIMPPGPPRVELRYSVVLGWIRKGDTKQALAAYEALLAEAAENPAAEYRWQYSKDLFAKHLEPWIQRLEAGEVLPLAYSNFELNRKTIVLCENNQIDEALALLDQHCTTSSSKILHVFAALKHLNETGQKDLLSELFSAAHQLALDPRFFADKNDDIEKIQSYRGIDHIVGVIWSKVENDFQNYYPLIVPEDLLDGEPRNQRSEAWTVACVADLFRHQIQWGLVQHAVSDLQASKKPWPSALAAMIVIDMSRGEKPRLDLESRAEIQEFEDALWAHCETLAEVQKARIQIGLRAVSTDRPGVASRVFDLIEALSYQTNPKAPSKTQPNDRLPFAEDHQVVAELSRLSESALLAGVLGDGDELAKSINLLGASVLELKHTANQAAMFRFMGGISYTFRKDQLARQCLDQAIVQLVGSADELKERANSPHHVIVVKHRLLQVMRDTVSWRSELINGEADRERISGLVRLLPAKGVEFSEIQFMGGNRKLAHEELSRITQLATQQKDQRRRLTTIRSVVQTYLLANDPGLAWETVTAIRDRNLNWELLPQIGKVYAALDPNGFSQVVVKLDDLGLKAKLYHDSGKQLLLELKLLNRSLRSVWPIP